MLPSKRSRAVLLRNVQFTNATLLLRRVLVAVWATCLGDGGSAHENTVNKRPDELERGRSRLQIVSQGACSPCAVHERHPAAQAGSVGSLIRGRGQRTR